jgi:hypothetical protein
MPLEGGTTAMTPQEIAARLPELTGGPYDDATVIALAQITAEAVRALNHATFPRSELSEPATGYTTLGQLAAAAHWLPQLCGQLARWLAGQNTAGRLACTLDDALASLDRAARRATRLGEALDQAHQATAWLHQPGGGGEDR